MGVLSPDRFLDPVCSVAGQLEHERMLSPQSFYQYSGIRQLQGVTGGIWCMVLAPWSGAACEEPQKVAQ